MLRSRRPSAPTGRTCQNLSSRRLFGALARAHQRARERPAFMECYGRRRRHGLPIFRLCRSTYVRRRRASPSGKGTQYGNTRSPPRPGCCAQNPAASRGRHRRAPWKQSTCRPQLGSAKPRSAAGQPPPWRRRSHQPATANRAYQCRSRRARGGNPAGVSPRHLARAGGSPHRRHDPSQPGRRR